MIVALVGLATLIATPNTLPAMLVRAKGGDVLKLEGVFGPINLSERRFRPSLSIEAKEAIVRGVVFSKADGIIWRGGNILGGARGYAMHIKDSSNIRVLNTQFGQALRGIVISQSTDLVIDGNVFMGIRVDGIDINGQRILVTNNECRNFSPIEGDHPDCVQGWSAKQPTAYVTVRENRAFGAMQGFFFRGNEPGGLGLDHIVVENNIARIRYSNGFVVLGTRGGSIRGNFGTREVGWSGNVNARLVGDGVICGNRLPDVRNNYIATRPC